MWIFSGASATGLPDVDTVAVFIVTSFCFYLSFNLEKMAIVIMLWLKILPSSGTV